MRKNFKLKLIKMEEQHRRKETFTFSIMEEEKSSLAFGLRMPWMPKNTWLDSKNPHSKQRNRECPKLPLCLAWEEITFPQKQVCSESRCLQQSSSCIESHSLECMVHSPKWSSICLFQQLWSSSLRQVMTIRSNDMSIRHGSSIDNFSSFSLFSWARTIPIAWMVF